MKKRIIALVTLLVLLLSICATSFAAKNPSATLTAASKSVKLGKQAYFTFDLDSGTYKKVDGVFRSKLNILILYKGKTVGAANWLWTGVQTYKCNAKIARTMSKGTYTMKYRVYKRKNASAKWTIGQKAKSSKFTVK